jgi:hypothetical protein
MHSSLMSSVGVRPEVTRDNMGHATVDVTQNVYNRTWWEERVEAVSLAAASVWRSLRRVRKRLGQCKPFCVNPHDPAISEVFEKKWSGREDLNLRPPGPETTTEMLSH